MKIKLLQDLPVAKAHGMTKGRIFVVTQSNYGRSDLARWFAMGDAGEEVGVLQHEAEEVAEEPAANETPAGG